MVIIVFQRSYGIPAFGKRTTWIIVILGSDYTNMLDFMCYNLIFNCHMECLYYSSPCLRSYLLAFHQIPLFLLKNRTCTSITKSMVKIEDKMLLLSTPKKPPVPHWSAVKNAKE